MFYVVHGFPIDVSIPNHKSTNTSLKSDYIPRIDYSWCFCCFKNLKSRPKMESRMLIRCPFYHGDDVIVNFQTETVTIFFS